MVRKVGIVHEIIVFISVYFTAQTTALTKINTGWGGVGGGILGMGVGFRKMGEKGMMHIFAHHQIFTWHSWTNNGCIFKKSKSGNIWNHKSYHSLSNRIHSVAWGLRHDTRLISIKIWGSILDARRKLILVRGSSLVTGKCAVI